jgi:hypothetical protein
MRRQWFLPSGWNRSCESASVQEFSTDLNAGIPGLLGVCFGWFWVRGLPFPNARHLGHPFQWKNTLPWRLDPAAKVRILRFKYLPPFRHDPGLQKPRLRYSPGLAPTTRLNALLNAASDS